jgi:hypothetical protein
LQNIWKYHQRTCEYGKDEILCQRFFHYYLVGDAI